MSGYQDPFPNAKAGPSTGFGGGGAGKGRKRQASGVINNPKGGKAAKEADGTRIENGKCAVRVSGRPRRAPVDKFNFDNFEAQRHIRLVSKYVQDQGLQIVGGELGLNWTSKEFKYGREYCCGIYYTATEKIARNIATEINRWDENMTAIVEEDATDIYQCQIHLPRESGYNLYDFKTEKELIADTMYGTLRAAGIPPPDNDEGRMQWRIVAMWKHRRGTQSSMITLACNRAIYDWILDRDNKLPNLQGADLTVTWCGGPGITLMDGVNAAMDVVTLDKDVKDYVKKAQVDLMNLLQGYCEEQDEGDQADLRQEIAAIDETPEKFDTASCASLEQDDKQSIAELKKLEAKAHKFYNEARKKSDKLTEQIIVYRNLENPSQEDKDELERLDGVKDKTIAKMNQLLYEKNSYKDQMKQIREAHKVRKAQL